MNLKSQTNYSILSSKSDFLKLVVTKYILSLNIADKIYTAPSLFGKCILVDEEAIPTPKKFIISFKPRTDFKLINLDEDPLPTLYTVLGIVDSNGSTDYKTYVRNKVYKSKKVKPNTLYYYMVLLKECITDKGFNFTKADIIIDTYTYESTHSQLEKYQSVNSYVMNPTESSLFELIKVYSQGADLNKRLSNIAYTIKNILDDNIPDYIKSRITFSSDPSTTLNYLMLAAEIATFEDFDTFISNMIGRLED